MFKYVIDKTKKINKDAKGGIDNIGYIITGCELFGIKYGNVTITKEDEDLFIKFKKEYEKAMDEDVKLRMQDKLENFIA